MKNIGFKILFFTSILLVIADFVSTLLCGRELIEYLESNPVYKYGGLFLIFLINIAVYTYYWWVYNKKKIKIDDRYFAILSLCMITGMRCLVIYGNIQVAFVEPQNIAEHFNVTIEEAKEIQINTASTVTEEQKAEYVKGLIYPNILPLFICIIAWIIFRFDHKIEVKEV